MTITDTNLLAADSKLVLISPDGTQSILCWTMPGWSAAPT